MPKGGSNKGFSEKMGYDYPGAPHSPYVTTNAPHGSVYGCFKIYKHDDD
jgi:hypothetical protein